MDLDRVMYSMSFFYFSATLQKPEIHLLILSNPDSPHGGSEPRYIFQSNYACIFFLLEASISVIFECVVSYMLTSVVVLALILLSICIHHVDHLTNTFCFGSIFLRLQRHTIRGLLIPYSLWNMGVTKFFISRPILAAGQACEKWKHCTSLTLS